MDKLNFRLAEPVSGDKFLVSLQRRGTSVRATRLRDRRWYLQVGPEKNGIFVNGHWGSVSLRKIVTRPSAFRSFQEYFDTLCNLFGTASLRHAIIERIDFAVDYPVGLEGFLASFDVARKRVRMEFLDDGSNRTGLNVGRAPEKLVIYDKGRRSGVPGPLTRLEAQISARKLPSKDFQGLTDLLCSDDMRLVPFGSVRLHDVALPDLQTLPSEHLRSRLAEFDVLLRREGYLSARTKLGASGNFKRDYGKFLELTPWSETPDAAVRRHLRTFFAELRLAGEVG